MCCRVPLTSFKMGTCEYWMADAIIHSEVRALEKAAIKSHIAAIGEILTYEHLQVDDEASRVSCPHCCPVRAGPRAIRATVHTQRLKNHPTAMMPP